MKTLLAAMLTVCLGVFAIGCSQEQQYQDAQEDLREERVETQETINDALEDGAITPSEREDVMEERADDVGASGDVADEGAELLEERINEQSNQ